MCLGKQFGLGENAYKMVWTEQVLKNTERRFFARVFFNASSEKSIYMLYYFVNLKAMVGAL